MDDTLSRPNDIAIIGMAGRFPGARNVAELWSNLVNGKESITFFSDAELAAAGVDPTLRNDALYVNAKGVLDDIEFFDSEFFGLTPRTAMVTDPQHRLLLECAWEALENAGYYGAGFRGRVGVFAGSFMNKYVHSLYANPELLGIVGSLQARIGNDKDFLPTLVSYKLDLKGPSIAVQTACSTSLVAVHLACQGLLSGDCDMALAGGVAINLPQRVGYRYVEGGIESPDGRCRAFDAKAGGTVFGSGLGMVVLKPMKDAVADRDFIHAVIRGSAVNNDGAAKVGYTAPSVDSQAAVISEAMVAAGIEPALIGYIEAHGTGTPLGDAVEIAALCKAFGTAQPKKRFCAIGSVKPNIGHLDAAAGVASLIKTALALRHRLLPPLLHFEQPNPELGLDMSPFYASVQPRDWNPEHDRRLAGVSSFGIGGTNVHVILEEPPPPGLRSTEQTRPYELVVLSAKTPSALDSATANLIGHLRGRADLSLPDVAFTLQVGREPFGHRRFTVASSIAHAICILGDQNSDSVESAVLEGPRKPPVAFMFPGLEALRPNAGRELYHGEPTFRQYVDECSDLLLESRFGFDIRPLLYPATDDEQSAQRLRDPKVAPAALFILEYALARLWQEWGVQPQAMIGHGFGEYVAACMSGVWKLHDALLCVAEIGHLIGQSQPGAMLGVRLPASELEPLLDDRVSVAAINSPTDCVLSGAVDRIDALERQLTSRGCSTERRSISYTPHSPPADHILSALVARFSQVRLEPPRIPYVSAVSGQWITAAEATDPAYWARHLRDPVRFDAGLTELQNRDGFILLEVGPGTTLGDFARAHDPHVSILSSLPGFRQGTSEAAFLLTTVGRLWLAGADIDWSRLHAHKPPRRVPLPTYPFERRRCWIDPPESGPRASTAAATASDPGVLDPRGIEAMTKVDRMRYLQEETIRIWGDVLGVDNVAIHDNFFDRGGHSLMAIQLMARVRDTLKVDCPPHVLFDAPTVAEFASALAERELLSEVEGCGAEEP